LNQSMQMRKKKATIRDIAAAAEVSYATAARVLAGNTTYSIKDGTRDRIQETARKLGYFPNPFARSLKTRRSWIIGICVHRESHRTIERRVAHQPQTRIDPRLKGIYESPDSDRYRFMIIPRDDLRGPEEQSLIQDIALLDGMIYVSPRYQDIALLEEIARGIPLVVEDSQGVTSVSSVSVDQRKALLDAVQLLARRGCRHLALFVRSQYEDYWYSNQRVEGFREGLADLGLPRFDDQIVSVSPFDGEYYRKVTDLLRSNRTVDGIIVPRDHELLESLQAIQDLNLQVGRDIRVVSVNQTPICNAVRPSITAIAFPAEDVSRTAFELLLHKINFPDSKPRHVLLNATIIERQSTLGVFVTQSG